MNRNGCQDVGVDGRVGSGDVGRASPPHTQTQAITLRHTFQLMSQLMSQMQEATLSIEVKTTRTDDAVRALAECVVAQNCRLLALERRLHAVEGRLDAEPLCAAAPVMQVHATAAAAAAAAAPVDVRDRRESSAHELYKREATEAIEDRADGVQWVSSSAQVSFTSDSSVHEKPAAPLQMENLSGGLHETQEEAPSLAGSACLSQKVQVCTTSTDLCPLEGVEDPVVPRSRELCSSACSAADSVLSSKHNADLGRVLLHIPSRTATDVSSSNSSLAKAQSSFEHRTAGLKKNKCTKAAEKPMNGGTPIKGKKLERKNLPPSLSVTSLTATRQRPASNYPRPATGGSQTTRMHDELGRRLLKAAQKGNVRMVRSLLDAGANANYHNGWKWTALHWAAMKAHAGVVGLLLTRGADVNARTSLGNIALHMAAYNDHKGRCASLLISAGSWVDIWNQFGRTPLHLAAECGNVAVVKALVLVGASKVAKDADGRTPFHVAKSNSVRRFLLFQ